MVTELKQFDSAGRKVVPRQQVDEWLA